uniref:Zinc metalloproteinase n=1 Tax=Strongyloides stercoralis TaxID=6248 RepID=A0AAF5DGT4_STRER
MGLVQKKRTTNSLPVPKVTLLKNEYNDLKLTKEIAQFLDEFIAILLNTTKNNGYEKQSMYNNMYIEDDSKKDPIEVIEESGYFEGDMVLNPLQSEKVLDQVIYNAEKNNINVSNIIDLKKRRKKRKIQIGESLEWDTAIQYYVEKEVNDSVVDEALKLMEKETCIKFERLYTVYKLRSGLRYFFGSSCYSHVGKASDFLPQDISIGKGCGTIGTVQHETMHALGVKHEQSRADRDNYLKLYMENVKPNHEHNFIKLDLQSTLTYDTKYDYGSTMHYHYKSFSKNKKQTMLPTFPLYLHTMGMDEKMSFLDVKLLNSHYCKDKCYNKLSCENGGYQDPNNCKICKCIKGFKGSTCSELPQPKKECGDTVLYDISKNPQKIIVNGTKRCLYHIKTDQGKRIKVEIKYLKYFPIKKYTCQKRNSLEIKYLKDKAQTGAFFCNAIENLKFDSKNHHVIIHHRSQNESNSMELTFKTITDE